MYEKLGDQVSFVVGREPWTDPLPHCAETQRSFANTRFCELVGNIVIGLPHRWHAPFPVPLFPVWEEDTRSLENGDSGLKRVRRKGWFD